MPKRGYAPPFLFTMASLLRCVVSVVPFIGMSAHVSNETKKIKQAIDEAKNILLHFHPAPDLDSVGSALAMGHVLKGLGKDVAVISGDSTPPRAFNILPGMEDVKNATIFDIDLSGFDLFIVLDSASPQMISRKAEIVFPPHLKTIVIDHHPTNERYGDINCVDGSYPATCQILFDLFKNWEVAITPEIAICLLVGIFSDTGAFRYPGTTSRTFEIAAELARHYPGFTKILFEIENEKTPGQVLFEGVSYEHIKTYYNGRVALSAISFETLGENHISRSDVENNDVANTLKSVHGWDIGVSMVEKEPGLVYVSMRTRDQDSFDVSKIAVRMGGGGHRAAAGALVKLPLEDAKKLFFEAVEKSFPELQKTK